MNGENFDYGDHDVRELTDDERWARVENFGPAAACPGAACPRRFCWGNKSADEPTGPGRTAVQRGPGALSRSKRCTVGARQTCVHAREGPRPLTARRRLTCGYPAVRPLLVELPGIEPVSRCWSLSRTGTEL
jgi:hypothetical protein